MHYIANQKFHEYSYRILSGSSMYAYLSHYFFIILFAVLIIRPYQIPFIPALILELLLVNGVIILTYMLFDFLYGLCYPRKTKEEIEEEKKKKEKEEKAKKEEDE